MNGDKPYLLCVGCGALGWSGEHFQHNKNCSEYKEGKVVGGLTIYKIRKKSTGEFKNKTTGFSKKGGQTYRSKGSAMSAMKSSRGYHENPGDYEVVELVTQEIRTYK
jgi:hypothetical protein